MLQSLNQNLKKPIKFVETIWAGEMELPEGGLRKRQSYLQFDDNNMMHCTFKDVETGELLEVEINASDNARKSDEIEKFFGGLNGSNFGIMGAVFMCDICCSPWVLFAGLDGSLQAEKQQLQPILQRSLYRLR